MADDYDYGAPGTTLLVLNSFGVSPYSARGLSQTLTHIAAAQPPKRTVNGGLRSFSFPQFDKLKSTITCNDMNAPALDGVWPGRSVIVDCVATLSYRTEGGAPNRPVVEGSSRVEGEFTIYRPRLNMKVMSWSQNENEYGASVGWSMELEEE